MRCTEMIVVPAAAPGTSHSWNVSSRGWVQVERPAPPATPPSPCRGGAPRASIPAPKPALARPGRPVAAGAGVTGFHWGPRAGAGIPWRRNARDGGASLRRPLGGRLDQAGDDISPCVSGAGLCREQGLEKLK